MSPDLIDQIQSLQDQRVQVAKDLQAAIDERANLSGQVSALNDRVEALSASAATLKGALAVLLDL